MTAWWPVGRNVPVGHDRITATPQYDFQHKPRACLSGPIAIFEAAFNISTGVPGWFHPQTFRNGKEKGGVG